MERIEVEVNPLPTIKSAYMRASSFGFYNPVGGEPYVAVVNDVVHEMSDGTHTVASSNTILLYPSDVGGDGMKAVTETLEMVYIAALHKGKQE